MSSNPPSEFAKGVFPLLLGGNLAYPLYGVAVAQVVSYFRKYPGDHSIVKYFIATLIVIDGAHILTLAGAVKAWYLGAKISSEYPRILSASIYFSYTIIALVQSAYVFRVWILSGRKWAITSVLVLLTLCQFVSGMVIAATQFSVNESHDVTSHIFGSLELSSAILCDVLISASLVYLLQSRRSGLRETDSLIDRVILYVIGTGLLTSVLTIVNLVTWIAMPGNFIFTIFHSILSKLYVNSLLATLNSRSSVAHNNSWQARGTDLGPLSSSIQLSIVG